MIFHADMLFDAEFQTVWGLSAVIAAVALFAMASAAARGALGWKRAGAIAVMASLAILLVGSAIVLKNGHYHLPHAGNSIFGFVISLLFMTEIALVAWLAIAIVAAPILTIRSNRVLRVNGSPT
jgi:uncharacterized membrane protein YhhN